MTDNPEWNVADRLDALQETRTALEAAEREWKHLRQQSRTLALELITIDKLSVSQVSQLSGHHRATLTVWLQVHNAEIKGRTER
jgi:hypothetical protein